jgi:hypothetical protein
MDDETKDAMEDEVKDTDADTKDEIQEQKDDYSEISNRLARMEETVNRIAGVVTSMQKAQANIVEMGGTIRETEDTTESDDEGFVPIEKLDFTI